MSKSDYEFLHPKMKWNILLSFLPTKKRTFFLFGVHFSWFLLTAPEMVWNSFHTKLALLLKSWPTNTVTVTVVIKHVAREKQYAIPVLSNTTVAKNILSKQANNYLCGFSTSHPQLPASHDWAKWLTGRNYTDPKVTLAESDNIYIVNNIKNI